AKTGAVDNAAFLFNATGVVVGDISVTQTVSGQTLAPNGGAYSASGIGTFNFGIFCTTCGGGVSDAFTNNIIFNVANASIADLTAPNPLGVFAADIGNTTTGATGPIDATTPYTPKVPDGGSTLSLLGSAVLGFATLRRRFGSSARA